MARLEALVLALRTLTSRHTNPQDRAASVDALTTQLAEAQQQVERLSGTEIAFRLRAIETQRQVEADDSAALRARVEELEAGRALQESVVMAREGRAAQDVAALAAVRVQVRPYRAPYLGPYLGLI